IKCGRNFNSNRVLRLVEASLSGFLNLEPVRPDDNKDDVALSQLAIQMCLEVGTDGDVVNIHEDLVAAEGRRETVAQPTSHVTRIFSAIIDENTAHSGSSKKSQIVLQHYQSDHYELAHIGPYRMSAWGHKRTSETCPILVRSEPESGHPPRPRSCPPRATSGQLNPMQPS